MNLTHSGDQTAVVEAVGKEHLQLRMEQEAAMAASATHPAAASAHESLRAAYALQIMLFDETPGDA